MGSLWLDRYHSDFLMILKEVLNFYRYEIRFYSIRIWRQNFVAFATPIAIQS